MLLLEPVSATLLAAILFSQPIGLNILSGGGLILLSNYLIISKPE
jgi:drug/metabolite transporter (DMT)-like permease